MDQLNEISRALQSFNTTAKQIQNAFSSLQNTERQLRSIFNPSRLDGFLEIGQQIKEITNPFSTIDWKSIDDKMSKLTRDIITFSDEMADEEIYVNFIYFDDLPLSDYDEYLNKDFLIGWMNENVEVAMEEILGKDYFGRHHRLLVQSLKAYKDGDVDIAVLAMLPPLEFFISNWLLSQEEDGEFDHENPTIIPWKKEELKVIYANASDLKEENALINHYFEYKALEGMHKIFRYTSTSKTPRNNVVHGSFDYDKLHEFDYVRLVFLLNSLLPLYQVVIKYDDNKPS